MKQIHLSNNKFALVDDTDFQELSQYKWRCSSNGYAIRVVSLSEWRAKGSKALLHSTILMHRAIMNPVKGLDVDHINHNRLDNQRRNLRLCSRSQNLGNQRVRPGRTCKGVYRVGKNRWHSTIMCEGRVYDLGRFSSKAEAAMAYNRKAVELFGEFAYVNIIANR